MLLAKSAWFHDRRSRNRTPDVSKQHNKRPARSVAVDLHSQEVRRTTDARFIVADQVLTSTTHFGVVEVKHTRKERGEVALDLALILRYRRDNLRLGDQSILTDAVTVEDGGRSAHAVPPLRGTLHRLAMSPPHGRV